MRSPIMIGAAGVAALALSLGLAGRPAPGDGPIVIRGGRIHTVTQGILDHGVIVVRDGKIEDIGPDAAIPPDARIIEAAASFICPGFIDVGTNLGTAELETVERDDDEPAAPVTPQMRALDAFNPDSRLIPEALKDGITTALLRPSRGNLLSGQSALVRLGGARDPRVLAVLPSAAVHGSLGDVLRSRSKEGTVYPSTRMGAAALLRQTLSDARHYLDSKLRPGTAPKPALQPQLEALVPVLKRELPLVIAANRMDDQLTALRIAGEFDVRIVIDGGAQAWRIKDRLAARKVPVILGLRTGAGTTVETDGARRDNAALLQAAGVPIAFQSGGIQDLGGLLAAVQAAVRSGLSSEAALRALTVAPAEIFGVADRLGSLEKGKHADIVIWDGDPILTPARARAVIVGGRVVAGPGA
ncbi:MAG: amidohydrolase family protein [Candidatus Aminicenantes bacterium]|nr:amidohydrolase family protein [Candidatus Aminicenantes bacterium]NLH77815.1 amidohydrolase family protein [Acidobacteriota bacterium]